MTATTRLDFSAQAAELISKKSIFFCGESVSLQVTDTETFPTMLDIHTNAFTIFMPQRFNRTMRLSFLDECLGHIEHYIKCVLWRSECEEDQQHDSN